MVNLNMEGTKMTRDEVVQELCYRDKRNPMWEDIHGWQDPEDIPERGDDCYCDNCFYGRDKLARALLRAMERPGL